MKKSLIITPILSVIILFGIWGLPTLQHNAPAMAEERVLYYQPEFEEGAEEEGIRDYSTVEEPILYENGGNTGGILKIILDLYKEIITAITMTINAVVAYKNIKKKKND